MAPYTARALQRTILPDSEANKYNPESDLRGEVTGCLLALDLGQKRVGVAISDEMWITIRALAPLHRRSWKELLRAVADLLLRFDARIVVIGLPLNLDGSEGKASIEARRLARNFELSLNVPVYLQDERLSSCEAEEYLRAAGFSERAVRAHVDSEAASIILRDFITSHLSPKP